MHLFHIFSASGNHYSTWLYNCYKHDSSWRILFVRKNKKSDKKSTDTWKSPCFHTVYLLLSPQALGDTFFNAVIQKSCYHTSGNEIQWVQLQSYFPEWSQYTLFLFIFSFKICLNTVDYHCPLKKPAHHKSIGLTYPQIRFCNNPLAPSSRHTRTGRKTHAHACM